MSPPMLYRWTGEALEPLGYFKHAARAQFKPGVTYRMVEVHSRSMNSHRHFFAAVNEAWRNLSEANDKRFVSPEHLRKWALTFTPFCKVYHYVAASKKEAERIERRLKIDERYSRVKTDGKQVWQFVPDSQAMDAMPDNRRFQQSKDAVLDVLAQQLGVTADELIDAGRNAGDDDRSAADLA